MNEQLTQIYGYLHGMWTYRWSALFITWVAAILGWMAVFSLPNQYVASAVVYIDTSSVIKPLLKGLAPETDADDELMVMSRVLLSRENLLSVIRETDMDLEISDALERERMVENLARAIDIKGGAKKKRWEPSSNIYEISYQGTSANRVYQVVSNLLNTMIEDTLNSTRTDTVAAQKFLDKQIEDYETRLTIAERSLADFKKANVGFMPDEKGNYYSRLQRAQDSVEQTKSALRLAEQRYKEMKKQLAGEDPILGMETRQSASAAKLQEYQSRLDSLLNRYTEKHPDVQSLRSLIEDLKKNPASAGSEPGSASESGESMEFNPVYQQMKVEANKASVEVETLKIQLQEQQSYVQKLKSSIDVIPEVEAQLSKLNRDYEVTRERYLDLVERRESAKLAQDAGQSAGDVTFRIIEPPIVPSRPSGPNRVLYLVAALFVAIGAGLGWSLLRYLLRPTFIDVRQLSSQTDFPVLGRVSLYLSPEHRKKRKLQLASFFSVALLLACLSGAVLWYQEAGTSIMGSFVEGVSHL